MRPRRPKTALLPLGDRFRYFYGYLGRRCPGCLAKTFVAGEFCRPECVLKSDSVVRTRRKRRMKM